MREARKGGEAQVRGCLGRDREREGEGEEGRESMVFDWKYGGEERVNVRWLKVRNDGNNNDK